MRSLLVLAAPLLAAGCAVPGRALGTEVQAYPAGVILAAHGRLELDARHDLTLRAGANLTDRQDFGEHDQEDGGGLGVGVGVRRFLGARGEDGWIAGARVDLWSLEIDWEDDTPATRGTTDVLVLQPTVELGYGWRTGVGRMEALLGFGLEINVDTDGEDVGEGAIGLIGLTWIPLAPGGR